jgi:hypothetical protein
MPYTLRKVKNKSCYRVVNKTTGKVKARCLTKKNAEKQVRLLHALENKFRMNFLHALENKFRKKSLRRKRRLGGGKQIIFEQVAINDIVPGDTEYYYMSERFVPKGSANAVDEAWSVAVKRTRGLV